MLFRSEEEVVLDPLGAEPEVLVESADALVVEIDVEELVLPEGLRDALVEAEAGHRLVRDLGVEADHLAVLEHLDEGERVPDGREVDVAAGLVRLGLDREADVVLLVLDVAAEEVQRLLVAGERIAGVLGGRDSTPSRPPQKT